MFDKEADVWHTRPELLNLCARRISVPGLLPKYPHILCTESGDVCQITTGESLINAALALSAFLSSPGFDLSQTYFLIAGIVGVNPKYASLGSVTLAKYAVQVDLQYEFDAREIPPSWKSGSIPHGSPAPDTYPTIIYGTEVFEVNEEFKKVALEFASSASLEDSDSVRAYRQKFARSPKGIFDAATRPPLVLAGDVAASNVFLHGHLLSEAFEHTVKLLTNGASRYTVTAQEDTATLAALLRAA